MRLCWWIIPIKDVKQGEYKNCIGSSESCKVTSNLMTTIAMVFGMSQLHWLLSWSRMENGLAWVIIGGLISSLFLTWICSSCNLWNHGESNQAILKGEKVDYEGNGCRLCSSGTEWRRI